MQAVKKSECTLRNQLNYIIPFMKYLFSNHKKEIQRDDILWASRKHFDWFLGAHLESKSSKAKLTTVIQNARASLRRFQEYETAAYGESLESEDVLFFPLFDF